jgi:hypothetical protein
MQPVASTCPSSTWTSHDLRDDTTCTTHRCVSASLEARLGNPITTCFQVKQVARSWRVSHTVLPPSVLWRNRQTEAHLVLRFKPRSHHDDFEAQIMKPELPILRPKSGNLRHQFWDKSGRNRHHRFWCQTGENRSYRFWDQTRENCPNGFEAKPLINCWP